MVKNKENILSTFITVLLGIVLASLILIGKMYYNSMEEFKKGTRFESSENYYKAALHYDRAIRCFFPLNPHVKNSIEKLWRIGERLEQEGKQKEAFILFENLRGSLLSTGSFFITHEETLARCSAKIRGLKSSLNFPLQKKQVPPPLPPNITASLLQGLGLLGWIFSAVALIYHKKTGEIIKVNRPKLLVFLTLFYSLWILGLILA